MLSSETPYSLAHIKTAYGKQLMAAALREFCQRYVH